jgi:signal transduction histidine kinase
MSDDSIEDRLAELDRRELEQAQFIADVSHELRTPLTILRGGIEVAIEGERSADEYRQALSEALIEVQHLTRISENLLFLTRGTSGRVTISLSRVDLCRFAESTAREFEPSASEKGLSLSFSAGVDRAEVLADKNRLKEVLHNLLENAIRYTEKGGVSVRVDASAGTATVCVEDTGVGIDDQDIRLRPVLPIRSRPARVPGRIGPWSLDRPMDRRGAQGPRAGREQARAGEPVLRGLAFDLVA